MGRDDIGELDSPLPADDQPELFSERTLLLGITGGIAAYKVAHLASRWTQRGARVRVLMTEAATRFVTPLTFQSLTRQEVSTDIWRAEEAAQYRPEHIDAAEADAFVVAPASADFMGRMAHGLASDIVSLTLLAYDGPVLLAPAMNDKMWAHAAVQANVDILKGRGVQFLQPGEGHLACGAVGAGRLAPLAQIDRAIAELLQRESTC